MVSRSAFWVFKENFVWPPSTEPQCRFRRSLCFMGRMVALRCMLVLAQTSSRMRALALLSVVVCGNKNHPPSELSFQISE
jgi:hypothetical protein